LHVATIATLGAHPTGQLLSNLIELSLVLLAAVTCLRAGKRVDGYLRRAWRLIGLAYGLWAVGQLAFMYYDSYLKQPVPTTSLADPFFLAFYLPLTFVLLQDPQEEKGRLDVLQILDLTQMTILLASVYSYFFLVLAAHAQERKEFLDLGLLGVWDLLNLVLVGLFFYRTASTPLPLPRRWLARMGAVLLVYAIGDGLDTYGYLHWEHQGGDWLDLGYSLSFAIAAAAAATWKGAPDRASLERLPLAPAALWTQFFPVLAPGAVLLMAAHMVTRSPGLAFGIMGVSIACFSLRLALTQHRQERTLALLLSSEARYRDLIENANDIILTLDVEGNLTTLNRLGEALTGYRCSRGETLALARLVAPEDLARAKKMLRQAVAGKGVPPFELTLLTREQRRIVVEVSSRALREGERTTGVQAIARDITERQAMEAALRTSEERFLKAFRFSPVAMTISSLEEGRYVDVNDSYLRLTGYSRADVIGRGVEDLEIWARPEKRLELVALLEERERVTNWEFQLRAKSGEIREGLLSAEIIELDGEPHLLAAILDLTDHRRLEEQHRQGQKMEAVGRLAGGIAHDFNNLLGVILGYADHLAQRLKAEPELARKARDIGGAAERAASLTRQLLAFSRQQVLDTRVLDLNRTVEEMADLLRRLIGEHIDLRFHLPLDLGRVTADASQIEQVILNLALNARDAMPEGGTLTVETTNVEFEGDEGRLHNGFGPGSYVMLAVTDTGMGMDATTKSQIFEPFFTTKPPSKGTGLGLATVYGIVKQSGGWIWVYSEPGQGSTFKVYLPRVWAEIDERPRAKAPRSPAARSSESVLLVEDQEELRHLTREDLEECGYSVLAARDCREAELLCEDPATKIDILVSDVVLPGGFGFDIARRMKALRPQVKVVYISGYFDTAVVESGQLQSADAFLQKPFHPADLLQTVRDVLDAVAAA
jgi:PAS domain S-box-containing protein